MLSGINCLNFLKIINNMISFSQRTMDVNFKIFTIFSAPCVNALSHKKKKKDNNFSQLPSPFLFQRLLLPVQQFRLIFDINWLGFQKNAFLITKSHGCNLKNIPYLASTVPRKEIIFRSFLRHFCFNTSFNRYASSMIDDFRSWYRQNVFQSVLKNF